MGVRSAQELLKHGDLLLVGKHLAVGLVLVDREVSAELCKHLARLGGLEAIELGGHFAGTAEEDLALSALQQIVEDRKLSDELLHERTSSLNKLALRGLTCR